MLIRNLLNKAIFCGAALLLAAFPAAAEITNAPPPSVLTGAVAETVASGLIHPWSMGFLPDGRIIVTERPGAIRIVDNKSGRISSPLKGAPAVFARGQGGMLDIVLAPDFATSKQIFLSFSEKRGFFGKSGTSVARATLVLEPGRERIEDIKIIFRQLPALSGSLHFGSRLVFARDGKLFVTLGERHRKFHAQGLAMHLGTVVRINSDGSAPPDNPYTDLKSAKAKYQPEIWSHGHRNLQAAAIHPETGKLWTVEHGAKGGDEINIPQAGKNYGWPIIAYGRHYSGKKIGVGQHRHGMEQPIYYWDPSIAPSGMAFYTANLHPAWKGNLFVGALKFRSLYRLILNGEKIVAQERLLKSLHERIRDVRQGPDGALYVLTDSRKGRILRVTPRT